MGLLGYIILLLICAQLLRQLGWRGAPVFVAVCAVMLLVEAGRGFFDIFSSLEGMFSGAGFSDALGAAIRIVGIGYLFGICADVCRELGENTLAKITEVVGRAEILIVIMPFLEEIIGMGSELIS